MKITDPETENLRFYISERIELRDSPAKMNHELESV